MSTGAVAQRLAVAAGTLRSWERRYAIGPAVRVAGKHRRRLPEDIARLEEMCRLTGQGVPPAEAARAARVKAAGAFRFEDDAPATGGRAPGGPATLPLGPVRAECRGLARAAVRLDGDAVEALLDRAIEDHGCVVAWEEIIAPTLHAAGRKWASAGNRYIEVEHLMSWLVSSTLRRRHEPRPPTREGVRPIVLACAPDELHSLPLEALWAALTERGLPVKMFGPAFPAEALIEAVRRVGPSLVVVWAQGRPTAAAELVSAVEGVEWGVRGARSHTTLLVGGPGWKSVPQAGTRQLTGLRSGLNLIEQRLAQPGRSTGASS
ncbi:MerR family transcriptional regulator [Streptomyces sp. NBC_01294]|uniref:MerR family transcriptional regulator n=1 Tax=Streptomyces sp. NBC_01294 TaxID=2903815 RepID=UPI002DDB8247|nr:MerR family transcriptional regulator [Streptomyces sp. NBC_01294]WRZ61089.1 MerR family transcriptional regulator [Streptomyces sp. NBC_01294]